MSDRAARSFSRVRGEGIGGLRPPYKKNATPSVAIMKGRCRLAQTRGNAPSPGLLTQIRPLPARGERIPDRHGPAIHVYLRGPKSWMPATSAGMTLETLPAPIAERKSGKGGLQIDVQPDKNNNDDENGEHDFVFCGHRSLQN